MDECLIAQMRFVISTGDAGRPSAHPAGDKVTVGERISCVYLTSSPHEAARAWLLLARFNVCVHCSTSLEPALLLLKTVGAKVLLVDHSLLEGTWPDALKEASERTAVVVAVPLRLASEWESVIAAGGFDAVLKPFALEELGPTVRNADRYAREFLTDPARKAREKAVLDAIRTLADEDPGCAALKSKRLLTRKVARLFRGARAFVMRALQAFVI